MAINNWFARSTSGYNSWATRDASTAEADFSASYAVLGSVSADLAPEYDVALSGEVGVLDGGGTIGPTAEASLTATWQVTTAVEANLVPFWQITQHPDPLAGRLRIVGKTPTVTSTVFYAVQADVSATWSIAAEAAANLTTYWAVGGGERATPSAGRLRLVGTTPTLTRGADKTVAPAAGTLRLAGTTPTVKSPEVVYPEAGRLRIFGRQPYVQPQYIYPRTGRVQLTGQQPTVSGSHTVEPLSGTLRLIGRAVRSADLTAEYAIVDATTSADFETFWNLNGNVSGYLWAYWHVEGRVGAISASQVVPTIQAAATTQASFTARMTSNRITQRAA